MQPRAKGEAWWNKFQGLLDEQNEWPTEYLFKFIVPSEELGEMRRVLGDDRFKVRSSSKGNYVSVTLRRRVASSEEVVAVYKSVGDVEGVIAL